MLIECFLIDANDPDFDAKRKIPGAMWLCPWYHNPETDGAPREGFLSIHYRTKNKHRAPITVCCPNGAEWCVDQGSSNGTGWKVSGEAPKITCRPSVNVHTSSNRKGYHGYLRNGVFTEDVKKRAY